jgi:hypothetical protein
VGEIVGNEVGKEVGVPLVVSRFTVPAHPSKACSRPISRIHDGLLSNPSRPQQLHL